MKFDYQVKIDELMAANKELLDAAEATDTGIMSDEDSAAFESNAEAIDKLIAQAKLKQLMVNKDEPTTSAVAKITGIVEPADKPNCGFEKPRDYIMAVMAVGQGMKMDQRLHPLAAQGSDEQSTVNNPRGGFLVPDAFSPELLMVPSEEDPTAGMVTDIPMANSSIKIPARVDKDHTTSVSGGLTVSRKAETVSGSSSLMKFEQIELNANMLFGLSFVTEELLADSAISFAAIIAQGFDDEFKAHMLDEKLNGTGVGEFQGVIEAPGTVAQAKENSQTATTIVFENVINMRSRAWRYAGSIWLAAHDTMPQLAALNDGTNHIYLPSASLDVPELLLGRPIHYSEFAPKLGSKGDLILGNWSQYLLGNLEGAGAAESIHVRFEAHERAFKFWMRNDGQPWWRSALTPKNGGATLSPFVVLDERV